MNKRVLERLLITKVTKTDTDSINCHEYTILVFRALIIEVLANLSFLTTVIFKPKSPGQIIINNRSGLTHEIFNPNPRGIKYSSIRTALDSSRWLFLSTYTSFPNPPVCPLIG